MVIQAFFYLIYFIHAFWLLALLSVFVSREGVGEPEICSVATALFLLHSVLMF